MKDRWFESPGIKKNACQSVLDTEPQAAADELDGTNTSQRVHYNKTVTVLTTSVIGAHNFAKESHIIISQNYHLRQLLLTVISVDFRNLNPCDIS